MWQNPWMDKRTHYLKNNAVERDWQEEIRGLGDRSQDAKEIGFPGNHSVERPRRGVSTSRLPASSIFSHVLTSYDFLTSHNFLDFSLATVLPGV
jgi:hypothetical protein